MQRFEVSPPSLTERKVIHLVRGFPPKANAKTGCLDVVTDMVHTILLYPALSPRISINCTLPLRSVAFVLTAVSVKLCLEMQKTQAQVEPL